MQHKIDLHGRRHAYSLKNVRVSQLGQISWREDGNLQEFMVIHRQSPVKSPDIKTYMKLITDLTMQ